MSRSQTLQFLSLLLAGCSIARGQFKTELIDDGGASAPCLGLGPGGGPVAKKCAEMFEQSGFLKEQDIGVTGFAVGTSAKDDGVITRVDPGSPAAQAGIAVGDIVLAVDGKPVKPTPQAIVAQGLFGTKGEQVRLTVRRGDASLPVAIIRAAAPPPPNVPKGSGFMVSVKPLINWRGEFAPCIGIGPAAMAAIAFCDSHFKPFGFIKVGELGSTGIALDGDQARIAAVAAGSPAEEAGIQTGDEILAIEGKPLTGSSGEVASRRLFGKVGEQRRVTIHSGSADKEISLTLAAKSNK